MIDYGNRDIETYGFSEILFAVKLPKAITLGDSQISLLYQKTAEHTKPAADIFG